MIRVLCLDGPWVGQIVKWPNRKPLHVPEPVGTPVPLVPHSGTSADVDPDDVALSYVIYTSIEVMDSSWGPIGNTFVAHTKAASRDDLRDRPLWVMVFRAIEERERQWKRWKGARR